MTSVSAFALQIQWEENQFFAQTRGLAERLWERHRNVDRQHRGPPTRCAYYQAGERTGRSGRGRFAVTKTREINATV